MKRGCGEERLHPRLIRVLSAAKTSAMPRAKAAAEKSSALTAVVGSDEGTVKSEAVKLATELAPADAGDFGVEIIDGAVDNAAAAVSRIHQTVEALQTIPFFGGGKLVWLKSANFLGDNPVGRASSTLEALEALGETLAAGLGEGVKFLLSATEIDKRRAFYKRLDKLADVRVFDRLDTTRSGWEEDAAVLVETRATPRGLSFADGEASELFTLLTGGDSRQIDNELEKLDLFLGPEQREIDADTVRRLVPLTRAGVVFELGNRLGRRDLPGALALIDQLLHQGESAIGILIVSIIPTVRNLLLVKDLQIRHRVGGRGQPPFMFAKALEKLPAEATVHLPRKKDGTLNAYALGFAAGDAHRFELAELRAGLEACLQTNLALITGGFEDRLALERLVIGLLTPKAPPSS